MSGQGASSAAAGGPFDGSIVVLCEDGRGEARMRAALAVAAPTSPTLILRLDQVPAAFRPPDTPFGADDDATRTAIATRRFVRLVEAIWRLRFSSRVPGANVLVAVDIDAPALRALALEAQAAVGRTARVWCVLPGRGPGPLAWLGAALPWNPCEQPEEAIPVV